MKLADGLIHFFGEYPGTIIFGLGIFYAVLELLEGRPFMKALSAFQ